MPEWWAGCGYRLLEAGADGRLRLTDAFLQRHLARPELAPVADSCAAERALHDALCADPRRTIDDAEIDAIADADARDNYSVWRRFRNRLLAASSIEAAYSALFAGDVDVPPLFVAELTQILVRHVLGDDADPIMARVGEMLFRAQKIALRDGGSVMAADDLTVERSATAGFGSLGELLRQQQTPLRQVDLDVLDRGNATQYWSRDERFDFAIALNRGEPAQQALCRVFERWITHFLGVSVRIVPQQAIDDERWSWHVGLDASASAILNDLYNRQDVDQERLARLLCLFELRFDNPADMRAAIAGRPVYLAMAMDERQRLRLKPQNLLVNLPLARMQ